MKIRKQNKGKLNFRSVDKIQPNFNVRCDVSANAKRPSRIYLKDNGKLQIPTIGDVRFGSARSDFDLSCKKQSCKYLLLMESTGTYLTLKMLILKQQIYLIILKVLELI